ncbi:indole-3-glycerol phosphate synthase TrpC [Crassaminicella profunda]|uniref:indole-3-glycerol phosphate synthase TrpC n=1 Tax=Crassaminicella profunda TaxID=1286698 RepID=UPI001CA7021A|nr:indole-3-glycerol phosphate synthase TrpC [Crassaminicella profunda]QZY53651.1 indole-3-glycerol phosphate synthase TrpC [Crassaminicella profunda]
MILEKIVAYKRKKVEEEKNSISFNQLIKQIKLCDKGRDFKKCIKEHPDISMIAEVKKASPSKGVVREDFDPIAIAKTYDENKVEAISVLTEDRFFQGKNEYLSEIKKQTSTPILRKDFIIDPYQIYQAKVIGADAILLIAKVLSKNKLIDFQNVATNLGIACLVEVHDQYELETVLATGSDIIGINNRDLKTFKTTLETTEELIKHIPKGKIVISESGIHTRKDMEFLKKIGVDGVLIGESLMRAKSIDEKLRELRGEMG